MQFIPFTALLITISIAAPLHAQQPTITSRGGFTLPPPPAIATQPVTDTYKVTGAPDVSVTDPYRYLEDAAAPATRAYIATENAYTQQYLDQVKILPAVRTQMAQLLKVDQTGTPIERNGRFFFSRRLAAENQGSIYFRTTLHGEDVKLIDGPARSTDGNTSVNLQQVTDDGLTLIYGVRVGGADEAEVHFFDVATRKDIGDVLPSARYYGVALTPDKKGVFYSVFTPKVGCKVYLHTFGAPVGPASDKFLFGGSYKNESLGEIDGIGVRTIAHDHYLVIDISRGVPATRQDILLQDLRTPNAPIVPLVYGVDARFRLLNAGDNFFLDTDWHAPNRQLLKVELGKKLEDFKTVIPEGKDVLEGINIVAGKLFVLRLHDVVSDMTVYSLPEDGPAKATGKIAYPGLGAASELSGRAEDTGGFYSFESIVTPPTIFHYDVKTAKTEVFYAQASPFQSADYELHEVFYTSKDGTRVPMFIAGKKGLPHDGSVPLLMTGYGGFALAELPTWNPEYAWWLQQGGFFALPDLRGGDEYGEAWHQAAMFEHKQNVFDDWFAAAEYLIANKYTSATHFAIRGRSNGGLLMGASMVQRPDLFAAIWCGYPLLDMLRYQLYKMGRTWTTEYGSAENPGQFAYIARYSPYQNVRPDTKYPAILFFTGDGDTRVDPMNARKMTPLMQQASTGGRPILLHYSLKGGHSAGISQTQLVEDYADEMAFLWTESK